MMRTTLLLLLLLPGCFSLTGEGYRAWMSERFAPAQLVSEKLLLEFSEERITVHASFLFQNEVQDAIFCCFPGRGYPVHHGLPDLPVFLPSSPEQMVVSSTNGTGLTLDTPPGQQVNVFIHEANDGVSHGFVTEFSNEMTRVDIRYEHRWQTLTDGRKLFVYILTSGARWRGPIGSLSVIERGRRSHGVRRAWPLVIPESKVEPDFDLVYIMPTDSTSKRDHE